MSLKSLKYKDFSRFLKAQKRCEYVILTEQKARAMYDAILRMSDDPDVNDAIKFLRQREVVHFQRFGEAMNILQNN